MPSEESDPHRETAALLQRITEGSSDALGELYDQVSATLFNLIRTILRSREEAEDTLQEVFVTIWKRADKYDPELGKPISWLMTVARNRAYDRARSLGRKSELKKSSQEDLSARTLEHLRKQWKPGLQSDQARSIEKALASLPPDQSEAIELAFLEGLTQQEIATRLQTPLGTIKARLRRGLLRLREQLTTIRGELA